MTVTATTTFTRCITAACILISVAMWGQTSKQDNNGRLESVARNANRLLPPRGTHSIRLRKYSFVQLVAGKRHHLGVYILEIGVGSEFDMPRQGGNLPQPRLTRGGRK